MLLKKSFLEKCDLFNEKEERDFFVYKSQDDNDFELNRDSSSLLEARYDKDAHQVLFSAVHCRDCNRTYRLLAQELQKGEYRATWTDLLTKKAIEPEDIVKTIFKALMRS
jgi:hypothetical protein